LRTAVPVTHLTDRGKYALGITAGVLAVIAIVWISGAGAGGQEAPTAAASPTPSPTVPADTTAPKLEVSKLRRPVVSSKPLTITGVAKGAEKVTVGGRRAKLEGSRFEVTLPKAVPSVGIAAVDAAGNKSTRKMKVKLHHLPSTMHAVHVSAYGWAATSLRGPVLKMVKRGQINTIEIDLKDESGVIGYDSKLEMANRINSDAGIYDLKQVIDQLHRLDVRVVGRLVAFRDPIFAASAWKHGHHERVIQTPTGKAYADYGGFTNFSDPVVRKYNEDIAEEAAQAGIDDVLYDYVRRPDGPIKTMRFKGLKISPERSVAGFVRETEDRLKKYGTRVGASVFGIAATRPKEIAQDIDRIAAAADYISPMLYPSHWASGEYNVSDPNSHPYEIIYRSLKDFIKKTKGTGAKIIPWIQDFSLGVHYGPTEVRAQLDAARKRGIHDWILWDPSVTYTAAALPN
jgi:hypothetical protein